MALITEEVMPMIMRYGCVPPGDTHEQRKAYVAMLPPAAQAEASQKRDELMRLMLDTSREHGFDLRVTLQDAIAEDPEILTRLEAMEATL